MGNYNHIPFHELVNGKYGRKVAYTDAEVVTRDNVTKILADNIGIFNKNKTAIEYLWNYYKGDQLMHYRTKDKAARSDIVNRIVENHAYSIVQFKTSQTFGEPVQYISRKDDAEINKSVDVLNDYMIDVDKQSKDIKAGEWQSATGTSFKAVQKALDEEIPFRIVAPSPLTTFIIYSRITEEPMLSVQELKTEDGEFYYLCFSKNKEFRIKGGVCIESKPHAYGGIPIVEYPNNWERISDIELVIDLLDAVSNMQTNRMDGVEQFVQSWIKFVNCDVDEQTFNKMKLSGALVVKSNNGSENKADVDVMTQELNQSETQVAKDDLWDNALEILGMPNRASNKSSGGDTMGATELKEGWNTAKLTTQVKDPLVKTSEKRLAKIVLQILHLAEMDLKITMRDFDVQINHAPTDNMVVKCQSLQYLLQCGISPMVAIKTVSLWSDAEKTYMLSKPYMDVLWKTIDQKKAEEEEQQAKQLLSEFEQNKLINTESTQVPETNADTMSIRK